MRQTRWDREVDPEGTLPVTERITRADALRDALYVGLGLKARRRNRLKKEAATSRTSGLPAGIHESADDRRAAEERKLRGRMGGLVARSRHDPGHTTATAREAWQRSFEVRVDPDGILPVEERHRRAEAARRAFYATLALRSLEVRHRRRLARGRPLDEIATAHFTATKRKLVGRIGAFTMLSRNDPAQVTRVARRAWEDRFDAVVDPHRSLPEEARLALVRAAKTDFYRSLAHRRRKSPSERDTRRA